MNRKLKIMLVAGARPNFMKIAPLVRAIELNNGRYRTANTRIDFVLVHTGQHYDIEMSEAFFRDLNLPKPDLNLEVGSGSHAGQTAQILMAFEAACLQKMPDWVVVVGDVNSTMACTLVASKMGLRVAHVEAGLRSFDRSMPEEINRLVTDALADLLFTPSEDADANLLREGIPEHRIKRVGNVMVDTLLANLDEARMRSTHRRFHLRARQYVFVTLHRPSNVDDRVLLTHIMACLERLSDAMPVIFPVHPRTRKNLLEYDLWKNGENGERLRLCGPLGYHDSIGLMERARFVLTDSGGVQEETTVLGVPCLTLRPNTERPITITKGTNKLTSSGSLHQDIDAVLKGENTQSEIPELWDGRAGERIIKALIEEA